MTATLSRAWALAALFAAVKPRHNGYRYEEKFVVTSAGSDPLRPPCHEVDVRKLSLQRIHSGGPLRLVATGFECSRLRLSAFRVGTKRYSWPGAASCSRNLQVQWYSVSS